MLWYRDAKVCIFGVNSALDGEQTLNHLTEYQIWLNGEVLLYKINIVNSNSSLVTYRISSNNRRRRLLNFETVRFSAY